MYLDKSTITAIIYWIILIADCILLSYGLTDYRYFTKCLLIPVLLVLLIMNTSQVRRTTSRKFMIAALLFSLMGDFFLLNSDDQFFISGLISFLLAHVAYILFFRRILRQTKMEIKLFVISFFCVVIYAIVVVAVVWPVIEGLRFPVILYSAILSVMVMFALQVVNRSSVKQAAFRNFIPAALFFLFSDSLLAINKFILHETFVDVIVMVTYAAAQFLLVTGAVKYITRSKKRKKSGTAE